MSLRIIFVCSGNICRSPMAEAIARHELDELDHSGVVISAGTLGIVGRDAAPHAVQVLDEIGLDLTDHRSQGVSFGLLERADHLPIMTPDHGETLLEMSPRFESKIVPLWQYTNHPATRRGIIDPVGGDLEEFRQCRDILIEAIEGWFDDLL